VPRGVQPVLGHEVEAGVGLFRRPDDHDGGGLFAGLPPPRPARPCTPGPLVCGRGRLDVGCRVERDGCRLIASFRAARSVAFMTLRRARFCTLFHGAAANSSTGARRCGA
jgi:hypothetical protein